MTKARGTDHEIHDRAAVARIAQWLVDHKGGSWAEIGGGIEGVSRETIGRLTRQATGAMSESTRFGLWRALRKLRRKDLADELDDAVVGPLARELIGAQHTWTSEQLDRYFFSPGYHFRVEGNELFSLDPADVADEAPTKADGEFPLWPLGEVKGLALQRMRAFAELYRYVVADDARGAAALRALDRELRALGISPLMHPALLRVLEPLLATYATGFIEKHWREFEDGELQQFVEAGVRRERLLLRRRGTNEERAQYIVRHGPHYLGAERVAAAHKPRGRK